MARKEETTRMSASKLSTLEKCERQFMYKYLENYPTTIGYSGMRGSAAHKGIEELLKLKIKDETLEDDALDSLVAGTFETKVKAEGVNITEADEEIGVKLAHSKAREAAMSMARYYRDNLLPHINPLGEKAIELKVEFDIEPNETFDKPVPVLGFIDVVDVVSAFGTTVGIEQVPEADIIIRDTKTKEKKPSSGDLDSSIQAAIYTAALEDGSKEWKLDKRPAVALDFLVRTPAGKKVDGYVIANTLTDGQIEAAKERMRVAQRTINSGVFAPTAADSWACSAAWCPFFKICEFGEKGHAVKKSKVVKVA